MKKKTTSQSKTADLYYMLRYFNKMEVEEWAYNRQESGDWGYIWKNADQMLGYYYVLYQMAHSMTEREFINTCSYSEGELDVPIPSIFSMMIESQEELQEEAVFVTDMMLDLWREQDFNVAHIKDLSKAGNKGIPMRH